MIHSPLTDLICIVTATADRGNAIREHLTVRDQDQVKTVLIGQSQADLETLGADLILMDPQGDLANARRFLQGLPKEQAPVVMLMMDEFVEDEFVTFYDLGAKEYLIKPVNPAYLISRMMSVLHERQLQSKIHKYERQLEGLGVITPDYQLPTHRYFSQMLEEMFQAVHGKGVPLSLVIAAWDVADYPQPLHQEIKHAIVHAMRGCIRASDGMGELDNGQLALMLSSTNAVGARKVIERFYERLSAAATTFDPTKLPIWFGVSDNQHLQQAGQLMDKANAAMTHTKEATPRLGSGS